MTKPSISETFDKVRDMSPELEVYALLDLVTMMTGCVTDEEVWRGLTNRQKQYVAVKKYHAMLENITHGKK